MTNSARRITGFLLGVVFGLPYSIVSEYINTWSLPGLPLAELPVGHQAVIIGSTLAMGILGLIIAWEEDAFWAIIAGAFFIVTTSSYLAFINSGSTQAFTTFLLFVVTFLPRLVLYVPLALFIAWVLRRWSLPSNGLLQRAVLLIVVLVLAVIVGSFSRLPSEALQAMRDANQLTLDGIAAAAAKKPLPRALFPVEGFSSNAYGQYQMRWSDQVDSLNVVRPATVDPVIESLVIIRFDNGYKFGCVYTPPGRVPQCINITIAP